MLALLLSWRQAVAMRAGYSRKPQGIGRYLQGITRERSNVWVETGKVQGCSIDGFNLFCRGRRQICFTTWLAVILPIYGTHIRLRTVREVLVNRFAENLFRERKPSQSVIVVPSSLGVFDSQGSARAPGLHHLQ